MSRSRKKERLDLPQGRRAAFISVAIGALGLLSIAGSVKAASPVIIQQPQSLIVSVGDPAQFSVLVQSNAPVTYQWLFDGVPLGGATNASLMLSNVQPVQAGNYSVQVANSTGTNQSLSALLQVCWEVQFGSFQRGIVSNSAYGTFSKFDLQGNLYVARIPTNQNGFSIVKATPAGQAWEVPFSTATGFQYLTCKDLTFDSAGRVCLVSVTATNWWTDFEDVIVTKLDGDGTQLWSVRYETAGFPHGISADPDENVYLAGTTSEGFDGNGLLKAAGRLEIIKFNPAGQRVWDTTNNTAATGTSFIGASAVGSSGNEYVGGTYGPPAGLGICNFDPNGTNMWFASLGTAFLNAPDVLQVLADGQTNAIVGLSIRLGESPFNVHYTYKLDRNGTPSWTTYALELSDGGPAGWALDQSNNVYLGFVRTGDHAAVCVKYDPEGNQLWESTGVPTSGFSFWSLGSVAIGIDREQNVLFAGQSANGEIGMITFQQNLVPGRPVIHGAPPSRTVASGTSVTFTSTSTGIIPLSYQWRRNNIGIAGATDSTLVLNNVSTSDSGSYSLLVTNQAGCAMSTPTLLTVVDVQPFHFEYRAIDESNITLRLVGQTNRQYMIEASTNLADWSVLFSIFNSAESNLNIVVPRDNRARFFRVGTTP